jgi:predicted transcriptional regulator
MSDFRLAMAEILDRIFPMDMQDVKKRRKAFGARWGIDGQKRQSSVEVSKELKLTPSAASRYVKDAEQALLDSKPPLHTEFARLVIETTTELATSDLDPLLKFAITLTRGTNHAELAKLRQELEPAFSKRLEERGFVREGARYVMGRTNG